MAYLDGGKDEIRRPRVRHETEGEVKLATYAAASSPQGLFGQVVAGVSKSEALRMWTEKSRQQLGLLRGRPLDDTDGLCVLIDGVWLTRELCVVVAVGIDTEGAKLVLDFEQGPSESTTTVEALLKRLRSRGVSAKADRRLLVLRDGSSAIAAGVRRLWPDAVQQECLVHAHSKRQKSEKITRLEARERARDLMTVRKLSSGKCYSIGVWDRTSI